MTKFLLLWMFTFPFLTMVGQNVGIATITPQSRLHIFSGGDASLATPSGYLMLGNPALTSIVMDDNEILARNAGGTSPLYINNEGGDIYLGAAGNSNVGIATSNPLERLHLASGNIRLDNASLGIILDGADRPLITRRFDAFTSGNYTGIGRWGLFMEANTITIGVPNLAGKGFAVTGYNANSSMDEQLLRVGYDNTGTKVIAQVNGDINTTGKLTRTTKTGNANMTSIAYATVGESGNILLSSGNINVTRNAIGYYRIKINGYTQSTEQFINLVTPYAADGSSNVCFAFTRKAIGGADLYGFDVFIKNFNGDSVDNDFNIVVFHPTAL